MRGSRLRRKLKGLESEDERALRQMEKESARIEKSFQPSSK